MKNMATALNADNLPKRVLIVGLGITGLSCARYLHGLGVPQLLIADSREHPPGMDELHRQLADVEVFPGGFDRELFASAEMLVVSPGVALTTPEIQHALQLGVPVIGDVELFAREVRGTVAAITGSNGKSTVTTLLGLMAAGKDAVTGGNLGKPVLDLLEGQHALYILELSSFQLETTASLTPEVAAVLNVSADHMDRYSSLDEYAQVKSRVYERAASGVYNLDDPQVMSMPRTARALFFTLGEPRDANCFGIRSIDGETWLCRGSEALLPAKELLLPGRHNMANALAALAMGTALGLPMPDMLGVLRVFPGLAHRTEYVCTHAGVKWYNDSKGTNPGATVAALQGLHAGDDSRTVLIAGGDCKQADFTALAQTVRDTTRALVLIGRDRQQIRRMLDAGISVVDAADMSEAVATAAELALPGDRVLLSPACASFDMFDGFEHRGNVFKEWVGRLCS